MRKSPLEYQLSFAGNATHNALSNEPIKKALSVYGYDEEKLKEGMSLYQKANALHLKQIKEYGEQFAATDAVMAAREALNNVYLKHLKIARIAFRNMRGINQELLLDGRRHHSHAGYLSQAETFYSNALDNKAIRKGLAKYFITEEVLREGLKLVEEMRMKYRKQLKEMGEAQEATDERNKAIDEMIDWFTDFTAISRIALEDNRQMLEVLGIVVK
jgi:tRNA-dihydrouridine synthase